MRNLVILFIIAFASLSWAQQKEDEKSDTKPMPEFSLTTGPLLPNQIEGVTEIMPTWGFRYSVPKKAASIDYGMLMSNAKGVTLYDAYLSLRANIKVETLIGIAYIGPDIHYDKVAGGESKTYFGGHIGGGMMMQIGGLLYFRTDMKFNVNPGTSLYIGFGFSLGLPDEKEDTDKK